MLRLFTPTRFDWWQPVGQDDTVYLDRWADAPRAPYTRGQALDARWHQDRYTHSLGLDPTGERFALARQLLLRYHFYPPTILHHVGTFDREQRLLHVGDYLVQRFHMLGFLLGRPGIFGRSIVDLVTLNQISERIDTPNHVAFAYITTVHHRELGEWSAGVRRDDAGALTLEVWANSRPVDDEPARNYWLMRRLQLRAHQLGIQHFTSRLANAKLETIYE